MVTSGQQVFFLEITWCTYTIGCFCPLFIRYTHTHLQKTVLARTETVDDGNCPFHPRTNGGKPLKPMVPEPKTMVMVPKKIIESMQ